MGVLIILCDLILQRLIKSRLPVTRLPITHTLTSQQLQSAMLSRLALSDKRAGQKLAGGSRRAATQWQTFFLDDLHLAAVSRCKGGDSSSPVLQLVNFAAVERSLIEMSRNYRHDLHNIRFLASCTPDTLGDVFPLVGAVFNPVPFLPLSDTALYQVFAGNVQMWAQQFPSDSIGDQKALSMVCAL